MKLTVTTLADDIFNVDVSGEIEIRDLMAILEFESGIPTTEMMLQHEGRPLYDGRMSLAAYGIKEGDVLLVQQLHGQLGTDSEDPSQGIAGLSPSSLQLIQQQPQNTRQDDPDYIRQMLLNNPDELAMLKHSNPQLADALLSGNRERFARVLVAQQNERAERERQRIRIINADPFDPEAQRLIAEEIRQENVNSNMEAAMEFHPESFGQVVMLYINCKVNGHPVKAFIDSGAQSTIMSQACAERCHIMRLVDQRWAGIAKGVGTQRIIGRVHLVQIQIGSDFLTSSFSILEEQPMDMLLGLDMLKRHQCCIDLKRNVLVIGTTGTETPFLTEGELPPCAKFQPFGTCNPGGNTGSNIQEAEDRELAQALAQSVASHAAAGHPSHSEDSRKLGATKSTTVTHNSTSSSNNTLPESMAAATGVGSGLLASDKFQEHDIQNLTKLGFPRQQAIDELRRFNGDVTQATVALLAKSLKIP